MPALLPEVAVGTATRAISDVAGPLDGVAGEGGTADAAGRIHGALGADHVLGQPDFADHLQSVALGREHAHGTGARAGHLHDRHEKALQQVMQIAARSQPRRDLGQYPGIGLAGCRRRLQALFLPIGAHASGPKKPGRLQVVQNGI